MLTKIKILLFTMITSAGLIVFSIFANINISNLGANIEQIANEGSNGPTAKENNLSEKSIERSDIDKDGLFDEEEPLYRTDPLNKDTDGDGFLDGEEVAAGCSPISASPKDCNLKPGLSQAETNLTDYFASLIVGGFLSNDLNKTNPKFNEHIKTLADEVEKIQKTMLSVDEAELKTETKNDDSKKTSQEYLNNLEDILKNHFLKKEEADIEKGDFADFDYSPYLEDAETTYKELSKLEPPSNWTELHKKLLKFFFELKTYFLNLNNQKEDPIKALLTLKQTEQLLENYNNLTKEISEEIKNNGLKTGIFDL